MYRYNSRPGLGIDWGQVSKWADRGYQVITGKPSVAAGAYDKFQAEIAPILWQKAGTPAFCFWFGETVGLDAGGNISVLGPSSGGAQTLQQIQALAASTGNSIWAYLNGQFSIVTPAGAVTPDVTKLPGPIAAGLPTRGNVLLIAGAALAGLLLFRARRKK